MRVKIGAADGGRTRDLELGKLALYQLSYRRIGQIVSLRGLKSKHPAISVTTLTSIERSTLVSNLRSGYSSSEWFPV